VSILFSIIWLHVRTGSLVDYDVCVSDIHTRTWGLTFILHGAPTVRSYQVRQMIRTVRQEVDFKSMVRVPVPVRCTLTLRQTKKVAQRKE
jgi:hypothetical protein